MCCCLKDSKDKVFVEKQFSVHNASLSLSLYVMNIDRLIVSGEPERDTITWNFIFHEDEYMISEKELLVNRLRLL